MIKTELVPEQKQAVEWILKQPRFLIADSVGFGKTLAALAAFDEIRKRVPGARLLVLANKNAVGNWIEQVEQHTDMSIVTGGSQGWEETERRVLEEDPDVIVLTYPSMESKYTNLLIELYKRKEGLMILALEEAHYVRNPGSKRNAFVKKVLTCTPVAWLISATPVNNRIEDIFYIMDLAMPGFFGSKQFFMHKYTERVLEEIWNPKIRKKIKVYRVTGYKNLEELMERIAPYVARRMREVKVDFEAVETNLSEKEMSLYLTAASGMVGFDYEDEEQAIRDFGARMPDLQRVVDGAIDAERNLITGNELSAKEKVMVKGLRKSFLVEKKAVVVFVFYQNTFDRLREVLKNKREEIGYQRMWTLSAEDGSPERRHEIASGFDHGDLLLMTSVGKEAMNLRRCDEMWLYNIPDSTGDVVQVIGRMTRRDSVYKEFFVKLPVVKETIDTYKVMKMLSRAAMIGSVIGGEATLPKGKLLSPSDLKDMRKELLWKISSL